MRTAQPGLDLIKGFESLRLDAYQDSVGIITIGYGTIRINGERIQPGATITEDEANQLLADEVSYFEKIVNSCVTVPLTQNQFDALICFVYNLGEGNLRSSTLLRKLNAGDYTGASKEFVRWNRAGGVELAGLTRRRTAERDLFLTP